MNELLRRLLFLPPQASGVAREVDALHYAVIAVTMLAATLVFVLAGYFVVRYRQRGDGETTPRIETSRAQEIGQAGFVCLVFLLFWVVGFRQYVRMETPPHDTVDVYVTAKQWMWKFSYPDGLSATSQLTVPEGRAIRLIMTSRDVIHSFYVPALRMKQDVIPGRYVTLWFDSDRAGTYPIFCAEFCGTQHSSMLGSLVVLPPDEYARWHESQVAGEKTAPPRAATEVVGVVSMAERGHQVATRRGCVACHTLDGQRTMGPSFGGLYLSKVTLEGGRTLVADEAYLTQSMMEPGADVVLGFQNAMPTYQGVLSSEEVAALVELIKSVRQPTADAGVILPALEEKSP